MVLPSTNRPADGLGVPCVNVFRSTQPRLIATCVVHTSNIWPAPNAARGFQLNFSTDSALAVDALARIVNNNIAERIAMIRTPSGDRHNHTRPEFNVSGLLSGSSAAFTSATAGCGETCARCEPRALVQQQRLCWQATISAGLGAKVEKQQRDSWRVGVVSASAGRAYEISLRALVEECCLRRGEVSARLPISFVAHVFPPFRDRHIPVCHGTGTADP